MAACRSNTLFASAFAFFFFFYVFLTGNNLRASVSQPLMTGSSGNNLRAPVSRPLMTGSSGNNLRAPTSPSPSTPVAALPSVTARPNRKKQVDRFCVDYNFTCEECDREARRVIAVSVYGKNRKYYNILPSIAADVKRLFGRGWVLRVYTDNPMKVAPGLPSVQIVDMRRVGCTVPPNPMCWRFLPALDKTVDVFLSRDTDNALIPRDRDAVMEWLHNTSYNCHVMRDHPGHQVPMLGGMWGFRGQPSSALGEHFRNTIYSGATQKGADQEALAKHLFPHLSCLAHDAYFCGNYKPAEWRPFPTRRDSELHAVGVPTGSSQPASCPTKCRKNINWTQC
jgi:hypothetical protein